MAKKTTYTEDNIQRLQGLEGLRAKPTMYLGERGNSMVFQALKELADNAIDESFAGRNDFVYVYADNKTNTYLVADKAHGIPVGLVPVDKKKPRGPKVSILTLIFTEIHTGGKFNDQAYLKSRGTHGIGASATNAVSSSFEVWTNRDKVWYYQHFKCGEPVAPLKEGKPPKSVKDVIPYNPTCGSIIRFTPDQTIVSKDGGKTKAKLDLSYTAEWLRNVATLNPGLTITFSANGKTKTYQNKGGLINIIKTALEKDNLEAIGKPFIFKNDFVSCALQWSTYAEDDGLKTYVCSGITTEHGEHEIGLRNALNAALTPFKKKNQKFAPKDVYYGMVGVFDYHMSGAEYSSQTKTKLSSNVSKSIEEVLTPELTKFFNKNKSLARSIIKRAIDVKNSKEAFKKMLTGIAEAKRNSRGKLPPGLVASPRANPNTREIYLIEGDSAAGSAKKARDSKYQELMKLDGKISNAAKSKLVDILKSVKIQNLLSAIGYNFDVHKKDSVDIYKYLRVNKIFLLPDADEDGRHIAVLILTLIYKLMPGLFDQGRVYLIDAPLFNAYWKGKRYFGDTLEQVSKALPKGCPKNIIIRSKGWGEISPKVLEEVAFNPKTRKAIQITPLKGKEVQYFESLVGSDTEARKKLLGI